jgi:putative spermidine/putrescine transport system substrate-binding protein
MKRIGRKSSPSATRRAVLGGIAATGAATLLPRRSKAADGRVVVGTWGGDYQNLLQSNIAAPLIEPQKIAVVYNTGGDPERRTKLLAEKRLPRGSFDIVALSAAGMYEMRKADTLLELDWSKIPNSTHILPNLKTAYSVPHIFSSRVILYNPSKIPVAPTSYNDLWDPKYTGHVGIIDIQYQTTIESAALINGGSLSNFEPGKEKLMALKKQGLTMLPTNEAMAQALKTEEIWICIMWKARGVMWQNAGVPVKIAYPKEGAVLYVSELGIAKNAPDKDAAYAYLDASLDPRAQRGFIKTMGYNPTVDNVVPGAEDAETAERIEFAPVEKEHMIIEDYDYIAKHDAQLKEWWDKEFKA